jgi:hypothetical protein
MHLARAALVPALVAAALAAPPARATGFSPGEETVLQVRYLGLPTGESRIAVGSPSGDVWPVVFQAKTDGFAGFLDIREHFVSYWDQAARTSRGSDLRAYEVGDYHQDSARFDRANGQATVTVQRKGRVTRKTFAIPGDVHDLTSALMWLRLQPLAPGQRYEMPIVASSKQFTLVAQVLGAERVETAAGPFDALKVQVRTQLEGRFSTKRDTFLWVSADPRHVLVKAEADFAIGSIVATLKSYRPGSQVAAR